MISATLFTDALVSNRWDYTRASEVEATKSAGSTRVSVKLESPESSGWIKTVESHEQKVCN